MENKVSVKEQSSAERFAAMVAKEYRNIAAYEPSDKERELMRGYFVKIDQALKLAEINRLTKNEKNSNHDWDEKLAVTWNNVDTITLAVDLAHYARIGLDMTQDNMLFPIPYKDKKRGCYTITLMEGYNGLRYEALNYSQYAIRNVIIECVYSTDTFKPIKKDANHPCESYIFEINNAFDRGELIGVFGYIVFEDETRNKLVVLNNHEVEKRKPQYASAEFWGGKTTEWQNGKKVEIEKEGWRDAMYAKTMMREIFSPKYIPRDPSKASELSYITERERAYQNTIIESEITEKANAGSEIKLDDEPAQIPEQTAEVNADDIPLPENPEF